MNAMSVQEELISILKVFTKTRFETEETATRKWTIRDCEFFGRSLELSALFLFPSV